MGYESHEQYAFEAYKGIEIADALTATGANKIWIGVGDASGHASGIWLTAEEAKYLAEKLIRIAEGQEARLHSHTSAHPYTSASANSPSHDPTSFPG